MKTIKFFINHSSFHANLTYVLIRQFDDNEKKIRIKMYIEDWWWNKQNEFFEKTTIIFLLIANNKILLFQHRDDWIQNLFISSLKI
jgi:1,2-phenylacetyl-CoA epoxidase catalytic subunit